MAIAALAGDVEHGAGPYADVVDVLGFTWNESCSTSRRGTSDSAGFKKTFAGTRMASGEIRCLHNQAAASPPLKSGDSTTVKLFTDGSDSIDAQVVINSRALTVDVDEGTVIEETYGFESNGAWIETRA